MSVETITAQALIGGALDLVGAKAANETLGATDGIDGLRRLNAMVGRWRTQNLLVQTIARIEHPITANDGSYTIGATGNVAITRPLALDDVRLLTSDDVETPLDCLTQQRYNAITDKTQTGSIPTAYFYQPTLPTGTLSVWPVPTDDTYSLAIYYPAYLSTFAALTTEYTVTAGTTEALEYNLAVRLATPYGKPIPPEVAAIAQNALADLKRLNTPLVELSMDSAFVGCGRGYSIETDS